MNNEVYVVASEGPTEPLRIVEIGSIGISGSMSNLARALSLSGDMVSDLSANSKKELASLGFDVSTYAGGRSPKTKSAADVNRKNMRKSTSKANDKIKADAMAATKQRRLEKEAARLRKKRASDRRAYKKSRTTTLRHNLRELKENEGKLIFFGKRVPIERGTLNEVFKQRCMEHYKAVLQTACYNYRLMGNA